MTPAIPILFSSWYHGLGGGETDLLALADALPTQYRPHLLLPQRGQLGEAWQARGLPLHILPFRGASTYFIPALWMRFPIVRHLTALLQRENIQLIHSDYHSLPFAYAAAHALNLPLMWTIHGWWFKPHPWQKAFFRPIPAVARTLSVRQGFLGQPPFMPPEDIPIIYSGVDMRQFNPDAPHQYVRQALGIAETTPLVAMIARFQAVKGHHTFLAMARHILAVMPQAHFIVAGEEVFGVGADQAYKARIMAEHQADERLSQQVHYLGFRDDPQALMRAADVVVCPSEFESFGKVNAEAMACGRPVVSTNHGGPAETIDDAVTGFLVPPADASALAEKVILLLQNPALRQQMGAQGHARARRLFAADKVAQQYMSVFDALLSQ